MTGLVKGFWVGAGILLALIMVLTAVRLAAVAGLSSAGWTVLALFGLASGGAYCLAAAKSQQILLDRRGLLLVFGLGLILRGAMSLSPPGADQGVNRYLWDGAVSAHRLNPYAHAPQEVAKFGRARDTTRHLLSVLREESGGVCQRIERPGLRSWHPPLMQALLAGAYFVDPWSPTVWRGVLACFDLATLALLVALLHQLRFPLALVAVYWWNPLLAFETYGACHPDIVALPFVVGGLSLSLRGRTLYAALLIALAAGFRLWPLVLLPLVLYPLRRHPYALFVAAAASLSLAAMAWLPLLGHGLGEGSGLRFLLLAPQTAGGLPTLLHWMAKGLPSSVDATLAVHRLSALLLLGWGIFLARGTATDKARFCDHALLAAAGAFLLSPWPLPWLALGLTPLLVTAPRPSLLLLTPLLFLHYLRPTFERMGHVILFDYGIVWLQSLPVLLLLVWEARGSYWQHAPWRPAPVVDTRHWEQGADYRWRSGRRKHRRAKAGS